MSAHAGTGFATGNPVVSTGVLMKNLLLTMLGLLTTLPCSAQTAADWTARGFKNVVVENATFAAPTVKLRHAFPLHIVISRQTAWDRAKVLARIARVREIYEQCQMTADPVQLVTVDPPMGYTDRTPPHDADMADMLPKGVKPTLFFLTGPGSGEAYGDDFAPGSARKNLIWTAWLGEDIESQAYKAARDASYEPVAHEIAHMLCNCGHVEDGSRNILASDAGLVNDRIAPAQCAQFRRSILVKELPRN